MEEVCITLTGLEAVGYHGVFDHERTTGQRFIVDLRIWVMVTDFNDELSGTIDYSRVSSAVVRLITGPPVNLIETLADAIAHRVLAEPQARGVEVTVHKPNAPLAEEVRDVAVTISRRRTDAIRT